MSGAEPDRSVEATEPAPPDAPAPEGRPSGAMPFPPRYRRFALPLVAAGLLAIVVGGLMLTNFGACTPLTTSTPCGPDSLDTCVTSPGCTLAPDGVILLTLALPILGVGIALFWGRHPEGTVPHPEPGKKRPKETARTRLEREREERRQARRERVED